MLPNREGQRVPQVTFRTRQSGEWVDVTTDDLFKGRTVVVFSLPGAFTPTCSSAHVPRYNELAPAFEANGVDDIVCISVNDAFVMNEWQKDQHADRITFIPDGNAEFTEGMGMLVDKHDLGFGERSWRYSMLVRDGVIEKMFIEPEVEGDPYEVSDADTMLRYINPNARIPDDVAVTGHDNWKILVSGSRPPLTSIDMNLEDLGRLGATRLREAIEGHPTPGLEKLACRLVVRGSTVG